MSFAQVFGATKPGSLHAALGVPKGQTIPVRKLQQAAKWNGSKRRKLLAAKAALVLRFREARLRREREE